MLKNIDFEKVEGSVGWIFIFSVALMVTIFVVMMNIIAFVVWYRNSYMTRLNIILIVLLIVFYYTLPKKNGKRLS